MQTFLYKHRRFAKEKLQFNNISHLKTWKDDILLIIFLSKVFFETEIKYWFTKFKMITFVWTIRKLRLMIFNSNHSIIIYTNYDTSSNIVFQIKLIFSNINKFNIKLIRIFIYLSQCKFEIYYWTNRFDFVLNALSRLFIKKNINWFIRRFQCKWLFHNKYNRHNVRF